MMKNKIIYFDYTFESEIYDGVSYITVCRIENDSDNKSTFHSINIVNEGSKN